MMDSLLSNTYFPFTTYSIQALAKSSIVMYNIEHTFYINRWQLCFQLAF
jgi:hypothetical protein